MSKKNKVINKPISSAIPLQNTDNQIVNAKLEANDIEKNNNDLIEKSAPKVVKILPMISNESNVAKAGNGTKSNEKIIIDDSPEEETSVAINQIVETPSREILYFAKY